MNLNNQNKSTSNEVVEINLTKSPLIKKDYGKISNLYFEITIPTNIPDQFQLIFQNYYTARISIVQEGSWSLNGLKTLLEKKILMEQCFNEVEAYNWHNISGFQLIQRGLQKGKPVRIYLFQLTDMWNKIDVRNLKVVYRKSEGSETLTAEDRRNNEQSLSSHLINDLRVLSEAAKVQSLLKPAAEYYYTQPDESKTTSRRKDRRKDTRRSQENTNV